MNNLNILQEIDFHDSLLENFYYDKKAKTATLNLDFCNWKQKWFTEKQAETIPVTLKFAQVTQFVFDDFTPNSDEIIEFELKEKNNSVIGVKIVVFNDIQNDVFSLELLAKNVEVKFEKKN